MSSLTALRKDLHALANPERAELNGRYFKTAKDQYAAGDVFIGVTVPHCRLVAKKHGDLSLLALKKLLQSKIHEERLVALLVLVEQFRRGDEGLQERIVSFYLANRDRVNNWDLVDLSAHQILGTFLLDKPRKILYTLAKSDVLWDRRIAMVATFAFIRNGELNDALALAENFLDDKHDLMHKASGWMLREVGKKNEEALRLFLEKYHKVMPRTMLRYAIEKFDEKARKKFMKR